MRFADPAHPERPVIGAVADLNGLLVALLTDVAVSRGKPIDRFAHPQEMLPPPPDYVLAVEGCGRLPRDRPLRVVVVWPGGLADFPRCHATDPRHLVTLSPWTLDSGWRP